MNTPETEAAVVASGGDWSPVLRETCRRLERQRDEYYNKAMTNAGLILDARAERDEAKEALANEMKWHYQTHKELVETQCKLMDVCKERDEAIEERDNAREEIDYYRNRHDLVPITWDN